MRDSPVADGAWEDDGHCYVCGRNNTEGLKLDFTMTKDGIETGFVGEKRHQGYRNVLHGGILMMVMDEVMVMLPYKRFGNAYVSVEVTFRLRRPVPVGEAVKVRAAFSGSSEPGRRLYRLTSEVLMRDGAVAANGWAKCVPAGEEPVA